MFDQHVGDDRPSPRHVLWDADGAVGIDLRLLRGWCRRWGYDCRRYRRVDTQRADEPREQCRVTFAVEDTVEQTLTRGDREYTFTTDRTPADSLRSTPEPDLTGLGRTPATFFELDERGEARLKTWASERTLELRELRLDGRDLVFDAVSEPGPGRVHGTWLATTVEPSEYWLTG